MSKRIEYKKGQLVGNLIYLREAPPRYGGRQALFECQYCGKEFQTDIARAKSGGVISCGCQAMGNNRKHGLTDSEEYKIWCSIKRRCYNPKQVSYEYYGERGIQMSPIWKEDFMAFYRYITALPNYGSPGMTLDRIDNEDHYKPGNLRWVDWHTQVCNKRMPTKNQTGYMGVTPRGNKFRAYIGINKKVLKLGTFNTAVELRGIRP